MIESILLAFTNYISLPPSLVSFMKDSEEQYKKTQTDHRLDNKSVKIE